MTRPPDPAIEQSAAPEPARPSRVPHPALILLLLGVLAWFAFARLHHSEGAVAWGQDLAAAQETAATLDKPVLMFFTADWCPPCALVKSGPLSDADIAAQIERGFVTVKVDMTDPDNEAANRTAMAYEVYGLPTFIATAPDGTELGRTFAGSAADLARWLSRYADPSAMAAAR